MIPEPVLEDHGGLTIVRDDYLPGGSKRRALPGLLDAASEWVYAGPVYGHAQLALALACRDEDRRATIFVAKRKQLHPLTARAAAAGAQIIQVPAGRMNVVEARARAYCREHGATLAPFGLAIPGFESRLADIARSLPITPHAVWVAAGSGTFARALARAWPEATIHAVPVGRGPKLPDGTVCHRPPEPFEKPAGYPPPIDSAPHYDAKVWRFISYWSKPGHLWWNVAGARA